ncbi:YajD family HNH nuclease [Thermodesulfobacteriota bacterium]
MDNKRSRPSKPQGKKPDKNEMDQIIRQARMAQNERLKGYREQSLRIHPGVCARCGREFSNKNLHMLTVHHKDHNHDNNPPDGSNWENLCLYCHDNEHSRYLDHLAGENVEIPKEKSDTVTHKPFAALADLLKDEKK